MKLRRWLYEAAREAGTEVVKLRDRRRRGLSPAPGEEPTLKRALGDGPRVSPPRAWWCSRGRPSSVAWKTRRPRRRRRGPSTSTARSAPRWCRHHRRPVAPYTVVVRVTPDDALRRRPRVGADADAYDPRGDGDLGAPRPRRGRSPSPAATAPSSSSEPTAPPSPTRASARPSARSMAMRRRARPARDGGYYLAPRAAAAGVRGRPLSTGGRRGGHLRAAPRGRRVVGGARHRGRSSTPPTTSARGRRSAILRGVVDHGGVGGETRGLAGGDASAAARSAGQQMHAWGRPVVARALAGHGGRLLVAAERRRRWCCSPDPARSAAPRLVGCRRGARRRRAGRGQHGGGYRGGASTTHRGRSETPGFAPGPGGDACRPPGGAEREAGVVPPAAAGDAGAGGAGRAARRRGRGGALAHRVGDPLHHVARHVERADGRGARG